VNNKSRKQLIDQSRLV